MAVMEKLKMFVVQEPVVTASCLIAGFGILKNPNLNFLPFANNFMSKTPLVVIDLAFHLQLLIGIHSCDIYECCT